MNEIKEYIKCCICDTSFMSMILMSLKHTGSLNKDISVALCPSCFKQVKARIDDLKEMKK